MAEAVRRSALAGQLHRGRIGQHPDAALRPAVRLGERHALTLVEIVDWGGASAMLALLGLGLPPPRGSVGQGGVSVLSIGPGRVLVVAPDGIGIGARLLPQDGNPTGAGAAAVDLSQARSCLRVDGEGARELVARGTSLDLDPGAFPVSAVAVTAWQHQATVIHAAGGETLDLYVGRSFARSLWEGLTTAAASFGAEVVG